MAMQARAVTLYLAGFSEKSIAKLERRPREKSIYSIACDNLILRGVAQLGSAPLWGSGGRGFKSRRSDIARIDQVR